MEQERLRSGSVVGNVNIFISGGYVPYLYGGGNGSVYNGNVNIDITGGTFGTIYGGGQNYTSIITGNVKMSLRDCTITGNLYGAGKGGSVQGNVTLNVDNTNISGSAFGAGFGLTDKLQYVVAEYNSTSTSNLDSEFNSKAVGTVTWDQAPVGFPIYDESNNEIISRRFHSTRKADSYYHLYEYGIKNSLTTSNVDGKVDFTINDCDIAGDVYGGGSIAIVKGDVNLTITNSKIGGTIFGGGDGATQPDGVELYKPQSNYTALTVPSSGLEDNKTSIGTFIWTDDEDIREYFKGIYDGRNGVIYNADGTTTSFSELSSEAQKVIEKYGNQQLIYSADVQKLGLIGENVNLTITSSTAGNIYAGGNDGLVQGNTTLTINSGTFSDVFGGGNSGNVNGDTSVTAINGTIENIYAGCNQSCVEKNTNLTIGTPATKNLKITHLAYGGGKGFDENNDGDASGYTTVKGNAEVLIYGRDTSISNYGSLKLGKVEGTVDVTFQNYTTGDTKNRFKTIHGIDRADDVHLKDSFVLLTNTNDAGELEGFKKITNLYVPKGSGIKISAPSELLGNFEGGGELYLDSGITLVVRGDVKGNTTLTLNAALYDEGYAIYGTENKPYIIVYGAHHPEENAEMGESKAFESDGWIDEIKYKNKKDDNEKDITIYYIDETVYVQETNIIYKIEEGINYYKEIKKETDAYILENGQVSEQVDLSYRWYDWDDVEDVETDSYKNIERYIYISGDNIQTIPIGTKIIMVIEDKEDKKYKYYYYIVDKEMQEIPLSEFKQTETGIKYTEIKNITSEENGAEIDKTNETTHKNKYINSESFRFIVDYSNSNNYLNNGDYKILLKLVDSKKNKTQLKSVKNNATNKLSICNKKSVNYNYNNSKEAYLPMGIVEMKGTITLTEINSNVEHFAEQGKELGVKLNLIKSDGEKVVLPTGTIVNINGTECTNLNNVTRMLLNQITNSSQIAELNIKIDMRDTVEAERLSAGDYKIQLEFNVIENGTIVSLLDTELVEFKIINPNYGIEADLIDGTEAYDKVKIFTESGETRTLKITTAKDKIDGAYVTIKLLRKKTDFTFEEITNTITDKKIIDNNSLSSTNTLTVTNNGLEPGTYRIEVSLYDKYGNYYSSDVVNFIVI